MQLTQWLSIHDLTAAEFGRRVGVGRATALRYAKGQRIPDRDVMARIVRETGGAVTANDFYGVAEGSPADPEGPLETEAA